MPTGMQPACYESSYVTQSGVTFLTMQRHTHAHTWTTSTNTHPSSLTNCFHRCVSALYREQMIYNRPLQILHMMY